VIFADPDASGGASRHENPLPPKNHFASRFNLIRLLNPSCENIWLAPSGKSVAFLRAFRTHKRALRDRHECRERNAMDEGDVN
jgi:hypothetical protein